MPDQVKVEDFEVFGQFRVALLKFAQAADHSLTNAESDIARTRSWLEGEQRTFWETQLRKRMEAVTKAKDAVRQKKLYRDAGGRMPSAVEEERALAKCVAAMEEAQRKIEAVRKWVPRLEREASLYRGGVARLSRTVADDIPRGVALLDRLAASLEQYVQLEIPANAMPVSSATAEPAESMSRGDAAEPPPVANPAENALSNNAPHPPLQDAPVKKEAGHVGS
jgi:hypothetical protein